MLASTSSPYLQSLPELLSAKRKLAEVAASFDANKYSFEEIESVKLDAVEFKNRLWRTFYISLTDAELGAIITLFDHDGSKTVDLREFVAEFFKFGYRQKRITTAYSEERKSILSARHQKVVDARRQRIAPIREIALNESWTPEDEKNALRKLTKAAFFFDARLGGFEMQDFFRIESFSPAEFREKLRRSFNVKLTNAEVVAMVNKFCGNFHERVDGRLFFEKFFEFRRAEQSHKLGEKYRDEKSRDDRLKKWIHSLIEKYATTCECKLSPATEKDLESACFKLKKAAAHTKPLIFGNIRDYYDASNLTPTQFRAFLHDVYYIDLTPGELDAAMKMFDINLDGTISHGEFTSTFYEIGLEERSKLVMQQKATEEKKRQKMLEKIRQREEKHKKDIQPKIKWPILPDDDFFEESDEDAEGSQNGALEVGVTVGKDDIFLTGSAGDDASTGERLSGPNQNGDPESNAMKSGMKSMTGGGRLPPLSTGSSTDGKKSLNFSLAHDSVKGESLSKSRSLSAMGELTGRSFIRKIPTQDFTRPKKIVQKLARTKESFAVLFPRISKETKDFFRELEQREREIRELDKGDGESAAHHHRRSRPRNKSKSRKSGNRFPSRKEGRDGRENDNKAEKDKKAENSGSGLDDDFTGQAGELDREFNRALGIAGMRSDQDQTGREKSGSAGEGKTKGGRSEGEEEEDGDEYEDDYDNVEYEMELDDRWKNDPIFESAPSSGGVGATPTFSTTKQQGEGADSVSGLGSLGSSGGMGSRSHNNSGYGRSNMQSPSSRLAASNHQQRLGSSGTVGTGGLNGTRSFAETMNFRPDSRSDTRVELLRPDSRSDSRGGIGSPMSIPLNATGLTGFRAPRRDAGEMKDGIASNSSAGAGGGRVSQGGAGEEESNEYEEEFEEEGA